MQSLLSVLMVAPSDSTRSKALDILGVNISASQSEALDVIIQKFFDTMLIFSKHVIIAIIVFFVGRWIIGRLTKLLKVIFERRDLDVSLRRFILSLTNVLLNILLVVTIVGILGIETSSFVALFASAGLGISMAMSGTLQNFASGAILMIQKPYRIGDVIEVAGVVGVVKDIQMFSTVLNTPDNKTIYIPNGQLFTGVINNYSKAGIRRVEWTLGISYGNDVDRAKEIVMSILTADGRVILDNELQKPFVGLKTLNSSSVDLTVRAWVNSDVYWDVYFFVNESIYKQLPENGIQFPFPQLDVHLRQNA